MKQINEMKLRTSKNRIQQTDARELKALLHEAFAEKLSELDVDITMVENGFIIEVPNSEIGAIVVESKFVLKPLDFDVITAGDEYAQKLADKTKKKNDKPEGQ